MNNLEKYLGKKVKITDADNKIWVGKVDLVDDADDNMSGYDSVSLLCDDCHDVLIEINENEIRKIEII